MNQLFCQVVNLQSGAAQQHNLSSRLYGRFQIYRLKRARARAQLSRFRRFFAFILYKDFGVYFSRILCYNTVNTPRSGA